MDEQTSSDDDLEITSVVKRDLGVKRRAEGTVRNDMLLQN